MSRWWNAALIAVAIAAGCETPDLVEFDWQVVRVEVAPSDRVLVVGDTMRLTAYARNADGMALGSVRIDWESEDDAIVGVHANGHFAVVEAKHVGTARIRAQSDGKTGEVNVIVTERRLPVASIEIRPIPPTLVIDEGVKVEAVLLAADGTVLGGREVTWSSSQQSIAVVNSYNNPMLATISGRGVGEAVITVRSEGVQGSTRVRVVPPLAPVSFVSITPGTLGAWVDQRLDYSGAARVLAANGLPLEGRTVTWSASDSTVARVQPNGEVRALRAGSTQIRATSGGVTGQATLVVFEQPAGNTIEYRLTFDWWDNDIHIIPPAAGVNYTDTRGVTKQVELYPERGTLKVDKQFTGNRWEQEIIAVGYTDDGTGARHTIEQRIVDRGTYTFDMTSDRPMVFTSEISHSQAFTGKLRQFEFHVQQAIGASATQEYRYRLPN